MPDDPSHTPHWKNQPGPDHRPEPYNWSADKPASVIEREILDRRLAAEKAHYERGFPVAGHDFAREAREYDDRENERSR